MLTALSVPVLRCGARLRAQGPSERQTLAAIADRARHNGVTAVEHGDGTLEIPGEAVTDPVFHTLALAGAATRHGAIVRVGFRVTALQRTPREFTIGAASGETWRSRVIVNCAGLHADTVARLVGDDTFEIYPRKGEFLVFDAPGGAPLDAILMPVPTERTRGVLVFPTVDGKVIAGPTAVDLEDKDDWSVRPDARAEILPKARRAPPRARRCRSDRDLRRAAPGRAGGQLPDRGLPSLFWTRQRRSHPVDGADRIARRCTAGDGDRRRSSALCSAWSAS